MDEPTPVKPTANPFTAGLSGRGIQERASRALSRIHSVLFRLILSFAALVFLVAVTISVIANAYFQGKYNAELAKFHELYLKNIEKELEDRLVDSSKSVYMELSNLLSQGDGSLFGPDDDTAGEVRKIYGTYVFLGNLAAREYDGIEAIHLYYAKTGLVVSSTGYRIAGGDDLIGRGSEWQDELVALGRKSLWKPWTRRTYLGIGEMSLFRVNRIFPPLSTPEEASVVISIDYRVDLVRQILHRLLPEDSGVTVLMSPDRPDLVLADAGPLLDPAAEAKAREIVGRRGPALSGEFVQAAGGPVLLTVLPLSDSGWCIVNAVPRSSLYQPSAGITLFLFLICLAAIALGLVVSGFLTSRIYNPLGRILSRVRSLFGQASAGEGNATRDEYQVIDSALDGISSRMGELEATIEAYRPAIKNELVLRLLEGEPVAAEDLEEAFALLGLARLPGYLAAGVISLPASGRVEAEAGMEAGQLLKYRLAGRLEETWPGQVLACVLPGRRIALLLGREDLPGAAAEASGPAPNSEAVAALARELAGEGTQVAIGTWTTSLPGLATSHAEAKRLAEFGFVFPDLLLLEDRADLLGRAGHSALPDADFLPALDTCLRNRDLPAFRLLLERFRQSSRGGDASVQAVRADLERVVGRVARTARDMGLEVGKTIEGNLRGLLALAESLDSFLGELSSAAGDICSGDRDPQAERNAALARRVKDYVRANLALDLSLDRVSEAMALSPGYMCTVFKEATGTNFVAFVKEARVEEAARLLAEGREPVQEIGRRTGFNSPAYFIRVFKARYGQTPLDYRRSRAGA